MASKHYEEQYTFADKYLWNYLNDNIDNFYNKKILVVGCGEGGVVQYFRDLTFDCEGLEINGDRVVFKNNNIMIGDISDKALTNVLLTRYDLIIMRDVIEHIENKSMAFFNISELLNDDGYLYITFPPKNSAFAGHQQNLKSWLRYIPFVHRLPMWLLSMLSKDKHGLKHMKDTYSMGQSALLFPFWCEWFELEPIVTDYFLSRPIFNLRYGLPTIKGNRKFCMGVECLLRKE